MPLRPPPLPSRGVAMLTPRPRPADLMHNSYLHNSYPHPPAVPPARPPPSAGRAGASAPPRQYVVRFKVVPPHPAAGPDRMAPVRPPAAAGGTDGAAEGGMMYYRGESGQEG